ncbi:hypothetical protein J2T13_005334 [Paenibacillus sp. DS2015]|uniref:hypothetical protein n=1 Tax=Paenibacillus sp. DS2015 TaxID=3373917 RepID=UPI003D2311D1
MIKLIFTLILVLSGGYNSNNTESNQIFEHNLFIEKDFNFIDNNGTTIGMGTSVDEIGKLIGRHVDTIDFMHLYIFDGVELHYKDNKVNGIIIRDSTPNNKKYKTFRGIGYGDKYDNVIEAYGDEGITDTTYGTKMLTYLLERTDNGNYELLKSNEENRFKERFEERFVSLSMNFDKKG